ncbi:hypothetical protein [Chitinolyticbacter meiyuanensis]|uniref:hypothetical protein n=1 Tax=Chitinolyticbacter meiyuanensis TaxID=682798 RepID=UPI0011E5DAD8|nr:hypothetical protein [Chitinolyticbacter meiyuanensis]
MWNRYDDVYAANDLPEGAITSDGDINNEWIKTAEPFEVEIALRVWFGARFCDPAEDTPYDGGEGGYQYIHGGPFDAADELFGRFGRLVSEEIIEAVVEELESDGIIYWAPLNPDRDYDESEYNELFSLQLMSADEPLQRLRERLQGFVGLLDIEVTPPQRRSLEHMVFSSTIGALEAFLWETVSFWVSQRREIEMNIVKRMPIFREQSIKLSEVYDKFESIGDIVSSYLQNLVWHRWDIVGPLLQKGLDIDIPSLKQFDDALKVRHDIVHRSGQDKDGRDVDVSADQARRLIESVVQFATNVDASLREKYNSIMEDDEPF